MANKIKTPEECMARCQESLNLEAWAQRFMQQARSWQAILLILGVLTAIGAAYTAYQIDNSLLSAFLALVQALIPFGIAAAIVFAALQFVSVLLSNFAVLVQNTTASANLAYRAAQLGNDASTPAAQRPPVVQPAASAPAKPKAKPRDALMTHFPGDE